MRQSIAVYLLSVCAFVAFLTLSFSLVVGTEAEPPACDSEISVIPETIRVYNRDDRIHTRANVFLRPDSGLNEERQFTVALTPLGQVDKPITSTVTTLPPLLGGIKTNFVIDVAPSLLSVAPGQKENQRAYYFALVLENVLDQFTLDESIERQDYGSIWLPSKEGNGLIQVNSSKSKLFEIAVSELPAIASLDEHLAHEQTTKRILSVLAPLSADTLDLPQMLVLIRWQDEPFSQDEYYKKIKAQLELGKETHPLGLPVSMVVVDIGQEMITAVPRSDAGIVVAPLGSVPGNVEASYPAPEPLFVGWDTVREEFRKTDTVKVLQDAIKRARKPIQRRFLIDVGWNVIVVREQADNLQLTVSTGLTDAAKPVARCSRQLSFPAPDDQGRLTRREAVLRSLVLGATILTMAATAVLFAPWLLVLAATLSQHLNNRS